MEPEELYLLRINELKQIEERLHRIRGLTMQADVTREIIDLQFEVKKRIAEAEEAYALF